MARDSVLSIASRGSLLSVGSAGSVLSVGSVGSALSIGSIGSFGAVLAGAVVLAAPAVALFIAFYPYASGLEVSREWLARMNWFKNWMWY